MRGDGGNEKGVTKENNHPAGSLLHVYGLSEEIKPCFGHLALLYRCVLMPTHALTVLLQDFDVYIFVSCVVTPHAWPVCGDCV